MEDRHMDNRFGLNFKIGMICGIILMLAAVFIGFQICSMLYKNEQPQITTSYITGKIDSVSELTTADLAYQGIVMYSDGTVPLLTQKSFAMTYTAHIHAGIDISRIKVEISDNQVVITIPDAQIQSVDVDSNSIKFYDERYALFNWTDKEDVVEAISAAEKDAAANANVEELISKANEQTAALLENILSDAIGDKELVIK